MTQMTETTSIDRSNRVEFYVDDWEDRVNFEVIWKCSQMTETIRTIKGYCYLWQQVKSSHFRGFFTGSDPVKNALFTGFPVKNTVKVQRFLTGFSQGLSQVFSQGKNSQGFSQGFAWVLTL